MSHVEFDQQASLIADQIPSLPEADRIAAACRGSGNPAALAWLAEGLRLDASTTVVDIGAGLGGPSAWLHLHFGCRCINLEVAANAAAGAVNIFATPTICGRAEQIPIRNDSIDVALLLGVLSVVARADVVLREACRVARRLGVIEYCSTTDASIDAGGSTFVPAEHLRDQIQAAGWAIVEMAAVTVPPPTTWTDAAESIDVELETTEVEVIDAIRAGLIVPFMLQAAR